MTARFAFPHPVVLLLGCVAIAAALTWVVPAGAYDRRDDPVTGRAVVVPGTYHSVEAAPVGLFKALVAVPKGLIDAASVIFLIFLSGGAFTVVDRTGALRRLVDVLARRLESRGVLVIPVVGLAFAAGGALMQMSEELVAFAPLLLVALAEEVPISADDDYESLSAKLAELGGELLVGALDGLAASDLGFSDQDDAQATYAEKVSADERHLSPARPAMELARIVRALTPHIGAFLELENGERLGVRRAQAVDDGPAPGAIEVRNGGLVLGSPDGGLGLEVVQPPGKKPMSAADFLRGHDPPEKAL